ncbi:MAG: helix-turn-helix domain-containing protein [Endomicrobia bacterium]|nr:helix-turn-helix domain-containing protein [Endomicrobiia bacterium]
MKGIGEILKEAREAKGLSLETVEKESRIMAAFLDAMERDDTAFFLNQENYDGILDFYAPYLGLNKNALLAQQRMLKMHEQRGTAVVFKAQSSFKELVPALKLIRDRQRVSIDLLEIHFGSYEKAKEILEYLQKNGFIAKSRGSYDWLLNNEKINEYLS